MQGSRAGGHRRLPWTSGGRPACLPVREGPFPRRPVRWSKGGGGGGGTGRFRPGEKNPNFTPCGPSVRAKKESPGCPGPLSGGGKGPYLVGRPVGTAPPGAHVYLCPSPFTKGRKRGGTESERLHLVENPATRPCGEWGGMIPGNVLPSLEKTTRGRTTFGEKAVADQDRALGGSAPG